MEQSKGEGSDTPALPPRLSAGVILLAGVVTTAVICGVEYLFTHRVLYGLMAGGGYILGQLLINTPWFRRRLAHLRGASRWGGGRPGEHWQ